MKKMLFLGLGLLGTLLSAGCRQEGRSGTSETTRQEDSVPLVLQLQQCARIYTTEYKIHKIVTNKDELKLQGNVINRKVEMRIPKGTRKIAIPIDVTIKGYTDLNLIGDQNIQVQGKTVTIILPDPQFVITSVRIDRKHIAQTAELMRDYYKEEDISRLTRQGVRSMYQDIPWEEFLETARSNTAYALFPILQAAGFEEIHIQYRDNLKDSDMKKLLLFKNIEK